MEGDGGEPGLRSISYLLRLWQSRSAGTEMWRAVLEDPDTRRRRGFATIDELFLFLIRAMSREERGEDGDEH